MTHPGWDKVGCVMFVSLFLTLQMSLSVLTAPISRRLVIILWYCGVLSWGRHSYVLCPFQVDLSPSFCVWSPHSCKRNLLKLMPPTPPPSTSLDHRSLLKMRYEWRGGGQHEMFFLLWDWGTGCEDGVFFPHIFWLLQLLSSSSVI